MPKPPSLSISSPPRIAAGPLAITGTVTAPDVAEPLDIDSVQVQFENQDLLAKLDKTNPQQVGFSATVQYPNDKEDHPLTVTVKHNAGAPVTSEVTIGPRGCQGCH